MQNHNFNNMFNKKIFNIKKTKYFRLYNIRKKKYNHKDVMCRFTYVNL